MPNETCEKCSYSLNLHDEVWCIAQQHKIASSKLLELALQLSSEKEYLEAEVTVLKNQVIHLVALNEELLSQLLPWHQL